MAGGTRGHDGVPIPLARVIGMKNVMAILAGKAVPPAAILEILELIGVALSALSCCKRLRLSGILLRGYGNRNRRNLFSLGRCE
jgi:hypothetical protein